MTNPTDPDTVYKIRTENDKTLETKVTGATFTATLAAIGIAVLNAIGADPGMLGQTPAVLEFILVAAIPPLVTFLGGYIAPHTMMVPPTRTRNPLSPR